MRKNLSLTERLKDCMYFCMLLTVFAGVVLAFLPLAIIVMLEKRRARNESYSNHCPLEEETE